MSMNKLLHLILLIVIAISGCQRQDNSSRDAAMRIADKLKQSSPDTTDAVKIRGYFIQSDKEVLIAATLVNWNSKDEVNRDLMKSLAYDFARGFACKDKALRELLVDGVALNVAYASNDDQDIFGIKILDQSCHDIATNPPMSDMLKQSNIEKEADSTSCTPVGSAHKTDTGKPLSVYRCMKPDGSIQYVTKISASTSSSK